MAENNNLPENEVQKDKKNILKWFIIFGIIFLLLIGIYFLLEFFYPSVVPGILFSDANFDKEINILIVGLDDKESVQKGEINADSIYIARIDGKENKLTISTVPSNYESEDKYFYELTPLQIQKVIGENKNVDIDYYFALSYNGFKTIVDKLNGIEIELDMPLEVPELGLLLKKGENLLSGKEALNFVRYYNYANNGAERILRQQKVINGIVDKVTEANILLNLPKLYTMIVETTGNVETNLDTDFVKNIINFLRNNKNIEINYEIMEF